MITLYTRPNCPYCDRAKIWLERNNISYTTINVSEDQTALDFIKAQGHKTVPQIYYNGSVLIEGGYTGLSKQDPESVKRMIEESDAA
jgi:glutaredoxin 3